MIMDSWVGHLDSFLGGNDTSHVNYLILVWVRLVVCKLLGPTPAKEKRVLKYRNLHTSHPFMLDKEGNELTYGCKPLIV